MIGRRNNFDVTNAYPSTYSVLFCLSIGYVAKKCSIFFFYSDGGLPQPPKIPGYKVVPHLVNNVPCARRRKLALGALVLGAVGVYVPQCTYHGNFEQIQCHKSTSYCWCVDKTGVEIPRTRARGKPTCERGKTRQSNLFLQFFKTVKFLIPSFGAEQCLLK